MDYKLVKIIEIGNVITGNTPSKKNNKYYDNKYIPFVKPNNFNTMGISKLYQSNEFLSEEGARVGRIAKRDAVLVTCIGSIGNVGIASQNICFNQQINAIEPYLNIIDNRYLAYSIIYRKRELLAIANAPVVPIINKTQFSAFEIPLPPLQIQKKIVEVLDKAQALIDKRKEQIKLLDDLIQSIFYDMFGDPVMNTKGWEIKKLGDCTTINPKKSEVRDLGDIQVSFIPMSNVSENGDVNIEDSKSISEVYKGFTYFKENDVLFAKITPCMENGKGCIAKCLLNGIGFGSTEFHVIRPKKELNSQYIYQLTALKQFRFLAESSMKGAVGQKRVPVDFLANYNTPVPPLDLQNQFASIVQKIESQKQLMEKSLEEMENNHKSLMQRAFNGELFD